MEEGFKERVKKLFGSNLFETVPKSSFPVTSWSVSDSEVERREWNRQPGGGDPERDERPCASAFDDKDGCLGRIRKKKRRSGYLDDVDELDEDEKGEEEDVDGEGYGEEDEQWKIQRSIGLDPTLDHEDEEDEYDREAVCKEWTDGRLYMRDVTDHGPHINYHSVTTDLLDDGREESDTFSKDPRADHSAANFRLQEDAQEGGMSGRDSNRNNPKPTEGYTMTGVTGDAVPKSILKRKRNEDESKPKKHVRFDPAYISSQNEQFSDGLVVSVTDATAATVTDISEARTFVDEDSPREELNTSEEDPPGVPDYIRNPSKYTKYTFESSDEDDDDCLNRDAFADFCKLIGRSDFTNSDSEGSTELPKFVVFTPRIKAATDAMVTDADEKAEKDDLDKVVRSISVAAEDDPNEYTAMDCDDSQNVTAFEKLNAQQKGARKYRAKTAVDESDST